MSEREEFESSVICLGDMMSSIIDLNPVSGKTFERLVDQLDFKIKSHTIQGLLQIKFSPKQKYISKDSPPSVSLVLDRGGLFLPTESTTQMYQWKLTSIKADGADEVNGGIAFHFEEVNVSTLKRKEMVVELRKEWTKKQTVS